MPHAFPMTFRSMNPFATASALIFSNSAAVTGLRGGVGAGLAASAMSNASNAWRWPFQIAPQTSPTRRGFVLGSGVEQAP